LTCEKFNGSNSSTWYLDAGASNHMCGMKETLIDIDENYIDNIAFRDLSQRLVEGKGRILIRLKNGEQKFISKVFMFQHEE
jgi:predicted ATPase